jgi:hypothetical protein
VPGNFESRRYRRGGENADDYARGARQWSAPRGNRGGNDFINIFPHNQYCRKYGGKHDDLAPLRRQPVPQRAAHTMGVQCHPHVSRLTIEDYVNPRYILNPLWLWDCDRPVNASAAYLFTTAERAREMRQRRLCAQSLTAQLQAAHHTGRFGRDRGLDRPRRQQNVRGCRAWAQGRRYIQSLRRLCTQGAVLHGGPLVARRQTRRCLRILRGRYRVKGLHPYGHVHRQHKAAPRRGWRTPGQGSGRDGTGGIDHAKQWRLDHVRQIPELTASDTGDHRRAASGAVGSMPHLLPTSRHAPQTQGRQL